MVSISKSDLPSKKKRKSETKFKLFQGLHWFRTPKPYLPHGFSGSIVFFTGLYFMAQALYFGPNHTFGYTIQGPQPQICLHLFILSAFVNALSGIGLYTKAPKRTQLAFLLGGLCQLSYVWFTFRFAFYSADFMRLFPALLINIGDKIFALMAFVFLFMTPILVFTQKQYLFVIPIGISNMALSLTFFYPLQFVIYGEEWLDCILMEYPYQIPGFVNYIYIPTIFSFSLIFFGFTLFLRKKLSPSVFVIIFVGLNLGVLFGTVLMQEVHITNVSTQKLILPCRYKEEDEEYALNEDWWNTLEQLLDTSSLAKTVLANLGIELNPPPTF